MTVHIVGHSRGLGEYLYSKYKDVRGYARSNGYDIEKDVMKVCYQIDNDDLVILNAHANGAQIDYLKQLENIKSIKVVVMGSIASTFHDPTMIEYSKQKSQLENYFESAVLNGHKWLYLKLTGESYKKYDLIYRTIEFWKNNTEITHIGFQV